MAGEVYIQQSVIQKLFSFDAFATLMIGSPWW